MRFSCDECGRSYVAADEVSGRAFRMRCKECGHEIVVRPPVASAPGSAVSSTAAAPAPVAPAASASRAPAGDAPGPAPAAKVPAGKPQHRAPPRADRPAFDPFEGQDVAADVTVATGSLEILDKTPPAVRLSPASRPGSAPAAPPDAAAAPAPTPPQAASPRPTLPPRGRRARMLPAEDEEMLGPPGEEGRGGFPRWIIAVVLAGVAAVGGILLRR